MKCLDCPQLSWMNGRPLGLVPRAVCCGSGLIYGDGSTSTLSPAELQAQAEKLIASTNSRQVRRRLQRKGW